MQAQITDRVVTTLSQFTIMISGNRVKITGGTFIQNNYIGKQGE
jgi:hypothetical protein